MGKPKKKRTRQQMQIVKMLQNDETLKNAWNSVFISLLKPENGPESEAVLLRLAGSTVTLGALVHVNVVGTVTVLCVCVCVCVCVDM